MRTSTRSSRTPFWLHGRALVSTVPGISNIFWGDYLEYLKRERSKKYHRARAIASPPDWNQYSKLDKRIMRTVRCAKKRFAQTTASIMASSNPRDAQKRIKSMLRKSRTDVGSSTAWDDSVLDPVEFTRHLATPAGTGYQPGIVTFTETRELRNRVVQAIRRAPRCKATEIDELFSEAFKLAPTEFSKVLVSFWVKCGQLQHVLDAWSTAVVSHCTRQDESRLRQTTAPFPCFLMHVK